MITDGISKSGVTSTVPTISDILEAVYGFADHPLAPVAQPNLFARPLDPQKDEKIARYYFYGHYHGPGGRATTGPGQGVLDFTPNEEGPPKVFLISGFNRTGRGSLKNLLLALIKKEHGESPIVVTQVISRNRNVLARDLAVSFVDNYILSKEQQTNKSFPEESQDEKRLRDVIKESKRLTKLKILQKGDMMEYLVV